MKKIDELMYQWAVDLFPICRSLTGEGVRETLGYLQDKLHGLKIKEIPSGEKVFDWVVPNEWNIFDAYIEDEYGVKWVDFKENNLHVVGYSTPIDKWMSLDDLSNHLHSLPLQPDAIPFIASYYEDYWGFCLTENQRELMPDTKYHVVIKSNLKPGVLNYAELIIPGDSDKEVLLSTYVCHPSMANNELSGPVVTAAIGNWLKANKRLKYTYRLVFIPETIGSIVYISKHLEHLQSKVIGGYVLTCIGDNKAYSFMPSRRGDSISDRAARAAYNEYAPSFIEYSYLERGSDERQYCSPGVNLPISSIMRSKYREYPEYHTSLDNLDFISEDGLMGGYEIVKKSIEVIENNCYYSTTTLCEPRLGDRGLMSTLGEWQSRSEVKDILNIVAYADGCIDCIDLSEKIGVGVLECIKLCKMLTDKGVLTCK
jgi:aminopeptidase-like protein